MREEPRYPRDPFRDAPLGAAQEALYEAYDELVEALEKLGNDDARGRMRAVQWSVDGAPEVGITFAGLAADHMRVGRYMLAPTLEEDALRNIELTRACFRQSRFARESILRYLHASGDLLAQLTSSALGLDIKESSCSLQTIGTNKRVQACEPLAKALRDYKDAKAYKYAAAATNHMKHRTFLPGKIKASLSEDRTEVAVSHATGAFDHNGEHPESSLTELAEQTDQLRLLAAHVLHGILTALPAGASEPLS